MPLETMIVALVVVATIASWTWTAAVPIAPSGPGDQGKTLLVVDVNGLSHDEQIVFTALQGIVNRASPRIYYVGLAGGQDYLTDPSAELWLGDAVDLPIERVTDPYQLLRRFRDAVCGLVIWDPALKVDTQNVATTLAGLHDVLPVSPELAEVLAKPPYQFPVRIFGEPGVAHRVAHDRVHAVTPTLCHGFLPLSPLAGATRHRGAEPSRRDWLRSRTA